MRKTHTVIGYQLTHGFQEHNGDNMNISDWFRLAGIGITLLTLICGIVAFCILKFNDFVHLEERQKETNKKIEKLDDKFDEQGKEIGKLCSAISSIDGYIKGKQDNNK